ncbi:MULTISPECIES: DUF2603 domain-containing protein [unclassified Helicobacter]|uniref:DUF2603 domain-containing protein n=1 Tax=unclassified Helicobacter TaxID=2593540 RepID=UPI000CF1A432|nr:MULTISPECIES: DUF2603 domain-containing protein [unclassified Helicobacter]
MALSKQQKMMEILQANNHGKIQKISDDLLEIQLQSGEFSNLEPCFLKDDKNREYVVLPQKVLQNIISLIRKAQEDRLKVELERDIISFTPIDFDDVMSVAVKKIEELRQQDGSLPNINTIQLIKQIKKEHPNLFLEFHIY